MPLEVSNSKIDSPENGPAERQSEQAAQKLLSELDEKAISEKHIVRLDARSAKYCPDAKDGDICRMTQKDAEQYAKEQGGHLPTTREFAAFMNPKAIIEAEYVEKTLKGVVPEGYYKVASQDENGKVDTFYFNNDLVTRKLSGELAKQSFWTSSIVLGKSDYAHVFYGPLGGGGGTPEEHARTYKHAVIVIGDKASGSDKK